MDHLKELSVTLGGKISASKCYHWNIGLTSSRVLIIKEYKGHRFSIEEYGTTILEVSCAICTDFSFSINNPDKIFNYDKIIALTDYPYEIYIDEENKDPFLKRQFGGLVKDFVIELKRFELSADESIFIYQNSICLALSSTRNITDAMDMLLDLINRYDTLFKKDIKTKIYRKNIPENLHALIPLMKKWSVGDDGERDLLVEESTEKQRKKLVKTVAPYMPGINEFLDSFGDRPLSDEAILLGNLAELVSELWTQ